MDRRNENVNQNFEHRKFISFIWTDRRPIDLKSIWSNNKNENLKKFKDERTRISNSIYLKCCQTEKVHTKQTTFWKPKQQQRQRLVRNASEDVHCTRHGHGHIVCVRAERQTERNGKGKRTPSFRDKRFRRTKRQLSNLYTFLFYLCAFVDDAVCIENVHCWPCRWCNRVCAVCSVTNDGISPIITFACVFMICYLTILRCYAFCFFLSFSAFVSRILSPERRDTYLFPALEQIFLLFDCVYACGRPNPCIADWIRASFDVHTKMAFAFPQNICFHFSFCSRIKLFFFLFASCSLPFLAVHNLPSHTFSIVYCCYIVVSHCNAKHSLWILFSCKNVSDPLYDGQRFEICFFFPSIFIMYTPTYFSSVWNIHQFTTISKLIFRLHFSLSLPSSSSSLHRICFSFSFLVSTLEIT